MITLSIPCPGCGNSNAVQPEFNFVQMGRCANCSKFFQFTIAVRLIDPSSSGEVCTGDWKLVLAPPVLELHRDGTVIYKNQDSPEAPPDAQQKT
jgi:hypothetical protein